MSIQVNYYTWYDAYTSCAPPPHKHFIELLIDVKGKSFARFFGFWFLCIFSFFLSLSPP